MSFTHLFILSVAVVYANLPFLTQRLLGLFPVFWRQDKRKPVICRLAEMVFLYLITGLLARLLEARLGMAFVQGWAFYVITFSLFCVLAFPGFACCYLVKHDRARNHA